MFWDPPPKKWGHPSHGIFFYITGFWDCERRSINLAKPQRESSDFLHGHKLLTWPNTDFFSRKKKEKIPSLANTSVKGIMAHSASRDPQEWGTETLGASPCAIYENLTGWVIRDDYSGHQMLGNNRFSGGNADVTVVDFLMILLPGFTFLISRCELGDRRSQGACRPQANHKKGETPAKVRCRKTEHRMAVSSPPTLMLIFCFYTDLCPPYSTGPISNFTTFLTLTYPHLCVITEVFLNK